MHITDQKLHFYIFTVGNLQNIFLEHEAKGSACGVRRLTSCSDLIADWWRARQLMWERFGGSERHKSRAEEVYSDSYRCNTCGRKRAEAQQQAAHFVAKVQRIYIASRNCCRLNWCSSELTDHKGRSYSSYDKHYDFVPTSVKPELRTPVSGRTPPTSPWQFDKSPRCCLRFPTIPDKPQLVSGIWATVFPTTHMLPSISWAPFASFSRERSLQVAQTVSNHKLGKNPD